WRLIPVDRCYDHDPVRTDPKRINLVHPVISLLQRIVRIATARPVTKRHGRRDAGFTRVNLPAHFGGQMREIEKIDGEPALSKNRFGKLAKPPAFRHLAWTGLVTARRPVDKENALLPTDIIIATLRFSQRVTRAKPVLRKLVAGIGEAGSCLP